MVFIEQVLSTINAISESLFYFMMTMIQNADYDDIVEFIALFLTLTIIFFFHFFFLYFAIRLTYGFEQTLLGFINATLAQIRFYRTTREIFQRLKTTSANEMSKKIFLSRHCLWLQRIGGKWMRENAWNIRYMARHKIARFKKNRNRFISFREKITRIREIHVIVFTLVTTWNLSKKDARKATYTLIHGQLRPCQGTKSRDFKIEILI